MSYVGPQQRNLRILTPHFKNIKDLPREVLPILAIDPGGITGWSLLVIRRQIHSKDVFSFNFDMILRDKVTWEHGELNCRDYENEAAYQLSKFIDMWPSAVVVVEDFILRPDRMEKSRDLLSPVRLTAKLESYLWHRNRRMAVQTPSQAKSVVTDERLKLWNCYTSLGGLQHARDADRHALLFVRRCMGPQGLGLRTAAWPHIFMQPDADLNKIEGLL